MKQLSRRVAQGLVRGLGVVVGFQQLLVLGPAACLGLCQLLLQSGNRPLRVGGGDQELTRCSVRVRAAAPIQAGRLFAQGFEIALHATDSHAAFRQVCINRSLRIMGGLRGLFLLQHAALNFLLSGCQGFKTGLRRLDFRLPLDRTLVLAPINCKLVDGLPGLLCVALRGFHVVKDSRQLIHLGGELLELGTGSLNELGGGASHVQAGTVGGN